MAFYRPLDPRKKEIRVLVLAPGSSLDDELHARTQVISLSQPSGHVNASEQQYSMKRLMKLYHQTRQLILGPTHEAYGSHSDTLYEAVSYCWDRKNLRATLQLHGAPFDAPASAVTVLRHLRYHDKQRILWIDAICINQQEIQERESQVMMMGDIYRSATRTVVWLGTVEHYTQPALDLAGIVLGQLPPDISSMGPEDFGSAVQAVVLPPKTDVRVLNGIFQLEWFYRQWVLQEVTTSKRHICQIGNKTVDWLDIELLTVWAHETRQWEKLRMIPELPCLTSSIRRGAPLYQSLSALALQSRKLLSTDPKDKIFALLSMTCWAERGEVVPPAIRPNYRESQKLCMCRATKAMILEDQNLSVLEEAETEPYSGPIGCYMKQEDLPWPSWCPPWHIPRSHTKAVIPRLGGTWYDASNQGARSKTWKGLKEEDDDCTLTVAGFSIETVTHVVSAYSLNSANFRSGILMDNMFDLDPDISLDEHQPTSAWRLNTLLEVTTAGRIVLADDYGAGIAETSFAEITKDPLLAQPIDSRPEASADSNRAFPTYNPFVPSAGRTLFLTTSGRLGLGPKDLQSGDKVVSLYGSAWPFVLRAEAEQYRLVGPCYLQGAKNDDLLATYEAAGRICEMFEIR